MELKKNDIIDLTIDGLTSESGGVGRYNGMAVFVANSAIGDVLKVRIIKKSKNYAVGKIEEIVTASEDRCGSDCELSNKCGGCVFRHITYEAELKAKQEKVANAVKRIGGIDFPVSDIIGAKNTDRYRNKAQYPVRMGKNGIEAGFFAQRSHRVIDCRDCLLQPAEFETIVNIVIEWMNKYSVKPYDEATHTGTVRHIYLRKAEMTDSIMVCLVINGKTVKHEDNLVSMLSAIESVKSIVINVNRDKTNVILGNECRTIYGADYITDIICGLKFNISPLSFYQVNRSQAEVLFGLAKEYAGLKGDETLLDLYCGTGIIGMSMADSVKRLIGVEIIGQAIENAKINARMNGINNAEFFCADAEKAAQKFRDEGIKPDVVVVDPPRKGCSANVVKTIADMSPSRIVYVSCDPATLARDMKLFGELEYHPQKITPVDLFPRTGHVETVVLMSRKDK